MGGVNAVELFLLGRTLMKVAEDALPTQGVGARSTSTRTVLVVLTDVVDHPDTSVGEIAARTGLPQSAVSACVARLREAGSVVAETDPHDRRRLLVRKSPTVSRRVAQVRAAPLDQALGAALGTDDPTRIAETLATLESLAAQFRPPPA